MAPDKRIEFFRRLRKANPHPKSELDYASPFELLVAVILSAQATDKSVNLATAKLYPVANTPEAIAKLGEAGLIEYIKTIGLYRMKAKNVVETCRRLLADHGGQVPRTREELEKLPGVGRKTANVVLNVAFGEPTMAVDTHIFRVANRTGLAPGKDPLAVELKLMQAVPGEFRLHAHHWLILHGRYTCLARKPLCPTCIVNDLCAFKEKTVEDSSSPRATSLSPRAPSSSPRATSSSPRAPSSSPRKRGSSIVSQMKKQKPRV
jgi:endonuclease III